MMTDIVKLSKQVGWAFKRKNPHLDMDDIIGEASLAMVEALQTFEVDRGRSVESWCVFLAHRALNKKFYDEEIFMEYIDDLSLSYTTNPERVFLAKEAITSVSKAAKEAVKLVFIDQIFEKQEIKKELREQGFAWNKIQTAFGELRRLANAMG